MADPEAEIVDDVSSRRRRGLAWLTAALLLVGVVIALPHVVAS